MIQIDEELEGLLKKFKMYNPEAYYHSIRVKKYVLNLLPLPEVQEKCRLNSVEQMTVCKGAMLHDVGKMALNNRILTIDGRLSEQEMEHLKDHTTYGCAMLERFLKPEEREIIENICRYHHERSDGKGYFGMSEVPNYVMVVAICDVYDALTSDRVYREAFSKEKAISMIKEGKCGQFDEWLVNALELAV